MLEEARGAARGGAFFRPYAGQYCNAGRHRRLDACGGGGPLGAENLEKVMGIRRKDVGDLEVRPATGDVVRPAADCDGARLPFLCDRIKEDRNGTTY